MKKIFLLLFGLIYAVNVDAKTYYSDYTEFKESDIKIEKSDIVDTKVEEKYLIYKENKIEAFYPSYMEITDMNKLDETKIETSNWLDEKPQELIGRNIITKELYEYQNMKKIRYIKLTDLINEKENIDLTEVRIYNKTTRLNYDIKNDIENIDIIKDDDLTNYITLDNDTEIIIDLKENVDINDLTVTVHFHINQDTKLYFTINLYGEEFENIYAQRKLISSVETWYAEYPFYSSNKAHFKLVEPLYEEKELSEQEIKQTSFNIVNLVTKYKTEDLYIKYEKIEREYLDDYYLEPLEDYNLDLETKKEFYYIRTRDKVEIKDELIIDNYDDKLEDFIISTTIDNIKITSNMDYYVNGEYDINFILPFKTIKEKLKVNIADNYIKALEVQNNYLKELEKENNNLIINNNKLNTEIKEILKNKDETVNEVNNQIVECEYELKELKNNKQELKTIEEEKDYKILIIIPIILILILLLFYLRKKSIQNNN